MKAALLLLALVGGSVLTGTQDVVVACDTSHTRPCHILNARFPTPSVRNFAVGTALLLI